MVIYVKLTAGGITYGDVENISVSSSIGENNSSSSFNATFKNINGIYKTTFGIGNEVIIYSDLDVNPPTTKIFTGIIENIDLKGKGQDEKIVINGRDYSARLMDVNVEPDTYTNKEVSIIVKDIIDKYTIGITTTNVDVTEKTITNISFNQTPVFDALKQLADLSGFIFWVDNNKDLNFKLKGSTSSGQTLDNTNIISSNFKTTDKEIYNEVWVYGDRRLTGWTDTFAADGTGSVYTLNYNPHNTAVTMNGSYMRGGIYEMIYSNPSGVEYLVDYDKRNIIFVSGEYAGDNIPPANGSIVASYQKSTPVIAIGTNRSSIDRYGKKVKSIVDVNIKDPVLAKDLTVQQLEEFSEPLTQGNIVLQGLVNLIAGQTIIVNMPNQNITNQTYDMLEVKYSFTKQNNRANRVLSVKVNQKLKNFDDTIKDIILDIKKLQARDSVSTDILPRLEVGAGSFGMRVKSWYIKSNDMGSSFILGVPGPGTNPQAGGILGSVVASGINFLGDSRSALTNQQSGGTF